LISHFAGYARLYPFHAVDSTDDFSRGLEFSSEERSVLYLNRCEKADNRRVRQVDRYARSGASAAAVIHATDQPLWWLRAMRLIGQMLLEDDDDPSAWLTLDKKPCRKVGHWPACSIISESMLGGGELNPHVP
jgi:hypothetical protein